MTPTRIRASATALGFGCLLAAGCEPPPRPAAIGPDSPIRSAQQSPDRNSKIARPDPALIGYDPDTRTLVLYDLPDASARWMLHVPGRPKGVPVNTIHQFMDDIDEDRVSVYYTSADGLPSPRVTLKEVVAVREALASGGR